MTDGTPRPVADPPPGGGSPPSLPVAPLHELAQLLYGPAWQVALATLAAARAELGIERTLEIWWHTGPITGGGHLMLSMLIAYDTSGQVVATLDVVVARDDNGDAVGLVDFAEHENAGGRLTDIWQVANAVGSATWPEWIGAHAHDFRVELAGPPGRKHIAALIHKTSGHRRERASIEAAIAERIAVAHGEPADIRDLVGGPDSPLLLDDEGRASRTNAPGSVPPRRPLPLVGARPTG